MRRATALLALIILVPSGAGGAAATDALTRGRDALISANRDADAARGRARQMERAAVRAADAASRARSARAALAARINAAEAERRAAEARVEVIARLLAERREVLATRRAPVARTVGAVQSLASRPSWLALVQPGSTDDLVHVRAVLGSLAPFIRERTVALRTSVERTERLRRQASIAATELIESGRRLEAERLALVRQEAAARLRSRDLRLGALTESDRAIALGEQARDIVDRLATEDRASEIGDRLTKLSGPLPRPDSEGEPDGPSGAYRLPVAGRIETGFGEVSRSGVRSRGLTVTVPANATVTAPAPGRIAFSGRFRGYGRVVILDHGDGWTTTVTGLAASVAPVGGRVVRGTPIGRSGAAADARVTVELRRRGVPVDIVGMLG